MNTFFFRAKTPPPAKTPAFPGREGGGEGYLGAPFIKPHVVPAAALGTLPPLGVKL